MRKRASLSEVRTAIKAPWRFAQRVPAVLPEQPLGTMRAVKPIDVQAAGAFPKARVDASLDFGTALRARHASFWEHIGYRRNVGTARVEFPSHNLQRVVIVDA